MSCKTCDFKTGFTIIGVIGIILLIAFIFMKSKNSEGFGMYSSALTCWLKNNNLKLDMPGMKYQEPEPIELKIVPGSIFKGLNLSGVNQDLAYKFCDWKTCASLCKNAQTCKGFGFHNPSKKCYLFASGGLVDGQPDFISGIKNN